MLATAVALAALVVIGVISWDAVAGFQGVCICGALGVAAGAALGRPESRAARIIGGGIGGVVAGVFRPGVGRGASARDDAMGARRGRLCRPVRPTGGGPRGGPRRIARPGAARWEFATRWRMRTARRITAARIDDDELVGRLTSGPAIASGKANGRRKKFGSCRATGGAWGRISVGLTALASHHPAGHRVAAGHAPSSESDDGLHHQLPDMSQKFLPDEVVYALGPGAAQQGGAHVDTQRGGQQQVVGA